MMNKLPALAGKKEFSWIRARDLEPSYHNEESKLLTLPFLKS